MWALGEIVTVETDVDRADRNSAFVDPLDGQGEALGQRNAARSHPDQDERVGIRVAFDDLVSDAGQDSGQRCFIEFTSALLGARAWYALSREGIGHRVVLSGLTGPD